MVVEIHQQPSVVHSDQGIVLVDGPGGLALAMTAEAALETGRRLLACANEALRQRNCSKGVVAIDEIDDDF